MKLKNQFSVLLLLLCIFGFVSCSNDDDHSAYQLELSEHSCEVMQARSVVIALTAHEHTTFDIKNPDLIDVVYTWEFGSYKAKIEIKGKQKGETDIVVTDHETKQTAILKVKVTEYPLPLLAVEPQKGNIFELMNFYLYPKNAESINSSELAAVCDSMVWTVEGVKGSYRVFEHEEGDDWVTNHLILKWGHCFKYPGEYKTYLTTWKDNQTISRHQLAISITDRNDFLVYNWSDITKDSHAWNSYIDVLKSSPDLMTTYGLSGTTPFVEVRLWNSNFAQSYDTFYDYFCTLYSAPTYEDRTDKMWQLYDKLFSEQKKDGYPVAIWVTEHANIILLMLDEAMEYPGYVVYAEPSKP